MGDMDQLLIHTGGKEIVVKLNELQNTLKALANCGQAPTRTLSEFAKYYGPVLDPRVATTLGCN